MMRGAQLQRLEVALCEVEAATPRASELLGELERRYGEAHRAYHTLTHVQACLGWLDRYRQWARRPAELELALWFHDAIYDPTRSDNEQRSAALSTDWLRALGAPAAAVARVSALVLSTKEHACARGDAALLASIDLAILGAPTAEYTRFEHAIVKEYAHVPEAAYRMGRAAVLQRFLDRPRIYTQAPIADALEDRARRNLAAALAALRGSTE